MAGVVVQYVNPPLGMHAYCVQVPVSTFSPGLCHCVPWDTAGDGSDP